MSRLIRGLVPLLLGIMLCAPVRGAEQFINVLTGGTSGVYYPLGVALGSDIGKAMPNVKTSVQATKASVENLNLLQAGPWRDRVHARRFAVRRVEGRTRKPVSRRR